MSTENIKAFLAKIEASPELREEVTRIMQENEPGVARERICALAEGMGHGFAAEDFHDVEPGLADEELADIAGGTDKVFVKGLGKNSGGTINFRDLYNGGPEFVKGFLETFTGMRMTERPPAGPQ